MSRSHRMAYIVFGFICLGAFFLMLNASLGDSAIMDELAHIPAGYGYVHTLDYRLNPEHPPLVKVVAALPLLFLNPSFPTGSSAWAKDVNGQWAVGSEFLYESGNDANTILRWARIGPMFLTLLTIILVYVWASELIGRWWALLPAFLFAFSPTVLAHGHYVTTDIGATFGVLVATYYFLKFLIEPSRRKLIYAGVAFGVAALTKFSTVLLVPYFLILIVVFYTASVARDLPQTQQRFRLKRFGIRAFRFFRAVILIFAVGYFVVVYPVYSLFTLRYPAEKQVADTTFILTSFAGGPTPPGHACRLSRCLADLDIWMSGHELTRPFAEYLLGVLMVLQRSNGGNTSYFLGEVSAAGSRLYFPTVYLLKEPLPVLLIILFALGYSLFSMVKATGAKNGGVKHRIADYLEINFHEFSMLLFVILYWGYSMKSPLNIGVRHLLPTIPFVYILAAKSWKRWMGNRTLTETRSILLNIWYRLKSVLSISLRSLVLGALLLWFLGETLAARPYFLSYFNELGGSMWGGYRYVTDSNYDWGQDLLRLKEWVANHPGAGTVAVDYFGGGSPKYYLGPQEENWQSRKGNPREQGIRWLAVSVNTLQGAIEPLAPGQQRNPEDSYPWLTALRPPAPGLGNVPPPDFRAGTSLFIYHL